MKIKQNMLIITLFSTLLFGVFLSFLGCAKIDVPEGTPKCIKDKIKKEKDKCLDKVYEYDYTGKKVFILNQLVLMYYIVFTMKTVIQFVVLMVVLVEQEMVSVWIFFKKQQIKN